MEYRIILHPKTYGTILLNEVRAREFLLNINTYGNICICHGALNMIHFQLFGPKRNTP